MAMEKKLEQQKNRDLLMVFPELPYPARANGMSIRYAPIIEELSKNFNIDAAVILRPNVEAGVKFAQFATLCRNVFVLNRQIKRIPFWKKLLIRVFKFLPIGVPYHAYCNDFDEIKKFLSRIAIKHHYWRIVWVGADYLDAGLAVFDANAICLDAIDSSYSHAVRNSLENGHSALEVWHTKKWEEHLIERTRVTTYVSQLDAEVFQRNPRLAGKVHVVPNGVYLGDVDSECFQAVSHSGTVTLGYLGNMAYAPNIKAVLRLKQIYDMARRTNPSLKLRIIGRVPVDQIRAMHNGDDVVVTGTVSSIWGEVQKVDIFVFPMVTGAGQQNKLLEAMFAGKPVICNKLANSGVGGVHNKHLVVCDGDEDFVQSILELSLDEAKRGVLGRAGKTFVDSTFRWSAILPRLQSLWF